MVSVTSISDRAAADGIAGWAAAKKAGIAARRDSASAHFEQITGRSLPTRTADGDGTGKVGFDIAEGRDLHEIAVPRATPETQLTAGAEKQLAAAAHNALAAEQAKALAAGEKPRAAGEVLAEAHINRTGFKFAASADPENHQSKTADTSPLPGQEKLQSALEASGFGKKDVAWNDHRAEQGIQIDQAQAPTSLPVNEAHQLAKREEREQAQIRGHA